MKKNALRTCPLTPGFLALSLVLLFCSSLAYGAENLISPASPGYKAAIPLDMRAIEKEAIEIVRCNPGIFGGETSIADIELSGGEVKITLSSGFLDRIRDLAAVEDAVHLFANLTTAYETLRLYVHTGAESVALDELIPSGGKRRIDHDRSGEPDIRPLEESSLFPVIGPLTGKTIVISPGHGWYWVESLDGWHTQRGDTNGVIEDMSNWRMASQVIASLERAGAYVYSCRERDRNTDEIIVDNDNPGGGYGDGDGWWTSSYSGYGGGTYEAHEAAAEAGPGTYAYWLPDFPSDGKYAVYVNYRAGENRVTDARYIIYHAGGESIVLVNQERNDLRWLYIGSYPFHAGDGFGEGLALSPQSGESGYVIADAVKFGGGMGSIERNGAPSGKPRWEEAARYWVEYAGAPGWAYNSDMADNSGDVTTRPKYANWQGADAYLSIHSNATGTSTYAYGTSTYMYNGEATPGSEEWRNLINGKVVEAIRSEWDSGWTDRGLHSANFGELRELDTMPGCLIETAFHDNPYDAAFLKRPYFRATLGRAILKATFEFFDVTAPLYPLPVKNIRIEASAPDTLRLRWEAGEDPTWMGEGIPDSYRIYVSEGGEGLAPSVLSTSQTHLDLEGLEPGVIYAFRVSPVNSGGEGFLSEPVVARLHHSEMPSILMVNGFDRLDRSVQEEENTRDYVIGHAKAIAEAGAYGFVSVSNDAVEAGLVDLSGYSVVDWLSGEEARLDGEWEAFHSFSPVERAALTAYANQGGAVLVTGSEIGWDVFVSASGDTGYASFYSDVLRAEYMADDAEEYGFAGVAGQLFEGISGAFDNGGQGVYDVDWPDVIAPSGASELCMTYSDADKGLGVCYDGDYRLVYLGIPLETIYPVNVRNEIMRRALEFLMGPEPFEDGDEDVPDLDLDAIDTPEDQEDEYDEDAYAEDENDEDEIDDEDENYEIDDEEDEEDGNDEEYEEDGNDEEDVEDGNDEEDVEDGNDVEDVEDGNDEEDAEDGNDEVDEEYENDYAGDGDIGESDRDSGDICKPGYRYDNGVCIRTTESGGDDGCKSSNGNGYWGFILLSLGLCMRFSSTRKISLK